MASKIDSVEQYFEIGCMRCPLGGTPDCKVQSWLAPMTRLRELLLESELTEEVKWSVPCYTLDGKNVIMLSAFKDYCFLSFFKGALMQDPENILVQQTKNVQAGRLLKFTTIEQVTAQETAIRAYIQEAIAVERSGLEFEYKDTEQFDFPDELLAAFEEDPVFHSAFEDLTPGRQRGYLLHFSGAKQSQTRINRIEKAREKIFEGKGLHDR